MKLVSIRFSHFCEKARWALDWYGVAYHEIPVLPFIHLAVVPWYAGFNGKGDKHSSPFSTPVLKTDRGEVIPKSSLILRYLSDRFGGEGRTLFPTEEAAQLDGHYNEFLGPHVRRVLYDELLDQDALMFSLARQNVSAVQAALFQWSYPWIKDRMRRGLKVFPDRVQKGVGYIRQEFEAVEKRLSDGRPFLCGDKFSAADISFASLGGAVLLPQPQEGYGAKLPDLNSPCPKTVQLAQELRKTIAGKWVLGLYRSQRGIRQIPASPAII